MKIDQVNLYKSAKFQERAKFYLGDDASDRSSRAKKQPDQMYSQIMRSNSSQPGVPAQLRNFIGRDLVHDPEGACERMRSTPAL